MILSPDNHPALLPCPFCGEVPQMFETDGYRNHKPTVGYLIGHFDPRHEYGATIHDRYDNISCLAQVGKAYCNCPHDNETADFTTKEEAAAAWNKRIPE